LLYYPAQAGIQPASAAFCQGGGIWTLSPYDPIVVRYQIAPHPDKHRAISVLKNLYSYTKQIIPCACFFQQPNYCRYDNKPVDYLFEPSVNKINVLIEQPQRKSNYN
jgi:hypothetical protein